VPEPGTELENALRLAVDAGEVMMQSGGEITRVEDTIGHIGRAFGARRVDAWATPTGFIVTGEDADGHTYTILRRVQATGNNLTAVAEVNELSRRAFQGNLDLVAARAALSAIIEAPPPYSPLVIVLSAAVASASFAYLLGSPLRNLGAAALTGLIVQAVSFLVDRLGWGGFARSWAGGMTAAACALALHAINSEIGVNWVIIGSIMTLVPGLAITNALREIMGGQLVSGVTRSVDALATAVGVAAGVGLVLGLGVR